METMFDTILQLPLFQGMTQEDMTTILGHVKLSFDRVGAGTPIVDAGEPCENLLFVFKGEVEVVTRDPNGLLTVVEQRATPCLIEPYRLFGLRNCYMSHYRARTECNVLKIRKIYVLEELFRYDIFRMNYACIVCNKAQALTEKLWKQTQVNTEAKLRSFFLCHVDNYKGVKKYQIKMTDLGMLLDSTRANVSRILNAWEEEGIVELHRKEIVLPDVSRLLALDLGD